MKNGPVRYPQAFKQALWSESVISMTPQPPFVKFLDHSTNWGEVGVILSLIMPKVRIDKVS